MKNTVKLFPYALARIAGGTLSEFNKINLQKTVVILDTVTKTQIEIDKMKVELSKTLYYFIKTVGNIKSRNTIIQLRRDIYNERPFFLFTDVQKILTFSITKKIKQYLLLLKVKQKLLQKGEILFEKEKVLHKKQFIQLIDDPNFQNGILLSSSTMFESLTAYKVGRKKKSLKSERSLMKYLSRMYTKPSPFSTFTTLSLATFSENNVNPSEVESSTGLSHIEFNNYLFQFIYGLLVQNKEIRRCLSVKLNQTTRVDNQQFVFLANNFNSESLQRITLTPALQVVYNFMKKKNSYIYYKLVNQLLSQEYRSASHDELEKFIDNLLAYGFLVYDLKISVIDANWDKKLIIFLNSLINKFPYLVELIKTLLYLRFAAKMYETASTQKRKQILTKAYRTLQKTSLHLQIAADLPEKDLAVLTQKKDTKIKKNQLSKINENTLIYRYPTWFSLQPHTIWYENTNFDTLLSLSKAKDNLQKLANLLNKMVWFEPFMEEFYILTDFFESHYQLNEHIDLLQFYEEYCREQEKNKRKNKNVTPAFKKIKDRNNLYFDKFVDTIKDRLDNNERLSLYLNDFTSIPPLESPSSFGIFFQLISKPNEESVIIFNSSAPGFGRQYSRFLKLFPDEVTTTLRKWNEIKKNVFLAELIDASVFNADMHPTLMPYIITSPGIYATVSLKRQIHINEIEVVYKKTDNLIHLLHKKTKKEIFAFDLGFQNVTKRSGLYNFLSKFTLYQHPHIHFMTQRINQELQKKNKNKKIVNLPRITYEKDIILQRQTWEIKKVVLPFRLPLENDWEYFRKVDAWRRELKIPSEIFIKVNEDKPQYINFLNPFLVSLLEKIIEKMKIKEKANITEMLPNSEQIDIFAGEKRVTEYLAQWYSN